MLVEFSVKNFKSIKEEQTFSLLATKDAELEMENTFEISNKITALRSAVICGANASGKSNLFQALHSFINFAIQSAAQKQLGDSISTVPFLLSLETKNKPSVFEIIFYMSTENGEPIRYRYGLGITKEKVTHEYLFAINNVREVSLFTRKEQEFDVSGTYFKEGTKLVDSTRNNASFLSVCAQNNGHISGSIITYFRSMFIASGLHDLTPFTLEKIKDKAYSKKILDFLHSADIQVEDFKIDLLPLEQEMFPDPIVYKMISNDFPSAKFKKLSFAHKVFDGEKESGYEYFSNNDESSGTQKLFEYAVPILDALENGTLLFIDEFDVCLHPSIVSAIISLFNSSETNPKNAQLIISCHESHVLKKEIFRRDQIWFCEKTSFGATDLYSLSEFKKKAVRNDAAFSKNYLNGEYGGVPHVKELDLSQRS